MTYFTMEFREVLSRYGDEWMKRGWPIYDESYRNQLVENIKDHFYFREIGLETAELFMHRYKIKMRLCMPKHNAMYRSMDERFDPLATYLMRKSGKDITHSVVEQLSAFVNESKGNLDEAIKRLRNETDTGTRNASRKGQSKSNTKATSRARSINSEFPQTLLSGNEDYASSGGDTVGENKTIGDNTENVNESNESSNKSLADNLDSTKSTSSGKDTHDGSSNTESNVEYILGGITQGRTVDVGTILRNWLEVAKSVDEMIMNDLESLFMGLYDTGDSFAGPYEHRIPRLYY